MVVNGNIMLVQRLFHKLLKFLLLLVVAELLAHIYHRLSLANKLDQLLVGLVNSIDLILSLGYIKRFLILAAWFWLCCLLCHWIFNRWKLCRLWPSRTTLFNLTFHRGEPTYYLSVLFGQISDPLYSHRTIHTWVRYEQKHKHKSVLHTFLLEKSFS